METQGIKGLGEDAFMKLLTTQLQYQDPLKPVGSTEFVSQLAQFSQLEQTTSLKKVMQTSANHMQSLNHFSAAGLIGKEVKGIGGAISLTPKNPSSFTYRLEGDADETTIQISNKEGAIVRIMQARSQTAGVKTATWDGLDSNGNAMPGGEYTYTVAAADRAGNPVKTTTYTQGRVSSVTVENGIAYLTVNGEKIPASGVGHINN